MDTVKLKINGIEVEAPQGSTILEAARLQLLSCNLLSSRRSSFAILSISACQSATTIADFILISVFLARYDVWLPAQTTSRYTWIFSESASFLAMSSVKVCPSTSTRELVRLMREIR